MLVLKDLVGLHKTVQLQLLQHYSGGIGLDYCDIEWFVLERNRGHSVICTQVQHFGLLLTMRAIPFLLWDSCPQ